MFKRINYEEWQILFPAVGFIFFFLVFLVVVIWVMRMKKDTVNRMENMPLEDDSHKVNVHAKRRENQTT
jgi:Na+-transporting methylmalonyl-CoA/oxaloacetate decarboxylase gamma subunit